MISREKYVLTVLAEEATEVAQRATKAIRFGMNEVQPGQNKTNAQRICDELNDLLGVVAMLNERLDFKPDKNAWDEKRAKVERFYQYSVELGETGEKK